MNHLHQLCITQGIPAEVTKRLGWGATVLTDGGEEDLAFSRRLSPLDKQRSVVCVAWIERRQRLPSFLCRSEISSFLSTGCLKLLHWSFKPSVFKNSF